MPLIWQKSSKKKTMLLRTKDKERLLEIFSSVDFAMEVWAYGSRVSGDAHDGSDLDLVIRPEKLEKTPIDILVQLKDKIKYSNIPIIVELFDWARLPVSFHQNIIAQHEVLFSNLGIMANEASVNYNKKQDKE
jgi:predicted nucleotidyltransferase